MKKSVEREREDEGEQARSAQIVFQTRLEIDWGQSEFFRIWLRFPAKRQSTKDRLKMNLKRERCLTASRRPKRFAQWVGR